MKNRLWPFLLSIAFLLVWAAPASAATIELAVNGGASSGLSGWTDPDGIWLAVDSYGIVTPYDACFFTPQDDLVPKNGSSRIYQDVPVSDYAGCECVYSAYVRTWDTNNTDETLLVVEFFDAAGALLDEGSVTSSGDPEWHKISVAKTIPERAATARLSLYAVYWYGSGCDSYFDDVSFIVSASTRKAGDGAPSGETPSNGRDSGEEPARRDIKVVLNGQTIIPADGLDAAAAPLVIDGTVYLPADVLPRALGMNVFWDSGSNTLYIDEPPQDARKPLEGGENGAADVQHGQSSAAQRAVAPPTLEDFLWLTPEIYEEGAPFGAEFLDFAEITGGWKAYIITDPEFQYDSSMESFLTAYIDAAEGGARLTLDWYYSYFGETGEDYLDDEPDSVFLGTWENGTLDVVGPGSVTLSEFFLWDGRACALGTMIWPDGVDAFVALVRDAG